MIASLKGRFQLKRISTQLYVGIGGAVALTVAASLVGWFSFSSVAEVQSRVNEGSVPEMRAAFGIAQHSSALVAAAPRLTSATTDEDLAGIAASVDATYRAFEEEVASLEQRGAGEERVQRIRAHADALLLNIEEIKGSMLDLLELAQRREALNTELTELNNHLEDIVTQAVDDQFFYTITGYRQLGEPPTSREEHFSERELHHYRHMAELQADANVASQILASAFSLADAPLIEPLRERFEAAKRRIDQSLAVLEDFPLHAELTHIFTDLFTLGIGVEDGFDLRAQEFALLSRQQELLALNRDIAVNLVGEVDGQVEAANANVQEATQASAQAIQTGRTLLLGISAISVGGALLLAWLYVRPILLRRLQMLSDWMRRMAGGDLEARVDVGGKDEVADMAAALEVFRLHALEIQRLNLVERMAQELQGKNDELESVLADLRRAQDQIVMSQKLAALGELTAGVAHEIRNPLNFVNNFSEVSGELLEELKEILEGGDELGTEQRDLIQDISQDLTSNLERIRSHGQRANRIVQDMLMMGRGSTERHPTNVNDLLSEYANLAFHSARATDPEFQLTLMHELDSDMVEIEAIPQDLGRVFLNMVGNSCHATDKKRRAGLEPGYMPTVTLTTIRKEEQVDIRIRDNGDGIPPDIIDKVFNPFFTTKPTDQGTGLGLAICSDIVRQHGGAISVDSEPGQFTEMIIELPIVIPVTASEDERDEEDEPAAQDENDSQEQD